MAIKYARCAHCRNFYLTSALEHITCPSCVYTTFRCQECGGLEGGLRSLYGHFGYYKTRGDEVGNHNAEFKRAVKAIAAKVKAKLGV